MEFTGITLSEAVKCATFNPASLLGLVEQKDGKMGRKGGLGLDWDADFVRLTDEGQVKETWVRGKKCWERDDPRFS